MQTFIDSHYLPFSFQGNIFLSVRFQKVDGTVKILVASLRRKIYLVEYQYQGTYMEPITKEIFFAYIPAASEVSSIDVLNRFKNIDDFVIGIVILKETETGINASLNLYSEYDLEPNSSVCLETIGQSCETLTLHYVPYGLHHVQISPHQVGGSYENMWLLPGSDNKIHGYRCYYFDRHHLEISLGDFFIEFVDILSIVMSINVFYYNDYHNRISCLGCENGYLRCCIVDCDNNLLLRNLCTFYENPISSVQLFALTLPEQLEKPHLLEVGQSNNNFLKYSNLEVNLLVTNTVYHSEVFMDILNHHLEKRHCLLESTHYDVCTCSLIADIDFDGINEVVLGTYGEKLLLFKYMDNECWKFVDKKSIPNPVHKLFYEDLTEDGVSELVTVTSKGVHIYQHDLKKNILPILHSRLMNLIEG